MSPFAELEGKRYATIAADPPWAYNVAKGLPSAGYKPSTAEAHYSTMTMPEIRALPVADLAAPDAYLFLWVTNPRLDGDRGDVDVTPFHIVRAWGFKYVTMLTWVKTGQMGMGWHFRGDTEHVLVGTRGKAGIPAGLRCSNVFTAPRRRHSQKPDVFFDIIEARTEGPRVELFSRTPRLGWDSWGHGYEGAA